MYLDLSKGLLTANNTASFIGKFNRLANVRTSKQFRCIHSENLQPIKIAYHLRHVCPSVETAETPHPIKFDPGQTPYSKSAHYRCGRRRTLCKKTYQCVRSPSAHATQTTDTPHLMSRPL